MIPTAIDMELRANEAAKDVWNNTMGKLVFVIVDHNFVVLFLALSPWIVCFADGFFIGHIYVLQLFVESVQYKS